MQPQAKTQTSGKKKYPLEERAIVWITSKGKEEDGSKETDSLRLFPKVYHLFHRSQVEEVIQ